MRLRRLTTSERIIAWRLASGLLVFHAEFRCALYGGEENACDDTVKVSICRIRTALADTEVSINSQHGQGYFIAPEHLDQFRSLLAQEIEDHIVVPYEPRIARPKTRDASADLSI